jgi:hypothetical protein
MFFFVIFLTFDRDTTNHGVTLVENGKIAKSTDLPACAIFLERAKAINRPTLIPNVHPPLTGVLMCLDW